MNPGIGTYARMSLWSSISCVTPDPSLPTTRATGRTCTVAKGGAGQEGAEGGRQSECLSKVLEEQCGIPIKFHTQFTHTHTHTHTHPHTHRSHIVHSPSPHPHPHMVLTFAERVKIDVVNADRTLPNRSGDYAEPLPVQPLGHRCR